MKKLHSKIMMLAIMMTALSLTACGGDEEDDSGQISSLLIGTWEGVYGEGWGVDSSMSSDVSLVQFKSNKTFIEVVGDEDDISILKGTWLLSDNYLVLKDTEGPLIGMKREYLIVKLEHDELVLSIMGLVIHLKKTSDSRMKRYL